MRVSMLQVLPATTNMVLPIGLLFYTFLQLCVGYPQQGIKTYQLDEQHKLTAFTKTVYKDTSLFINVNCDVAPEAKTKINISYFVQMQPCFVEDILLNADQQAQPILENQFPPINALVPKYYMFMSRVYVMPCNNKEHIVLESIQDPSLKEYTSQSKSSAEDESEKPVTDDKDSSVKADKPLPNSSEAGKKADVAVKSKRAAVPKQDTPTLKETTNGKTEITTTELSNVATPVINTNVKTPQFVLISEGVYTVYVSISPVQKTEFRGTVEIQMKSSYGYLSAVDWPLLPFYGVMCGIYVLYGVAWLLVSACQWRDLLRIQFWIGGVILLGMLEKAVFYAEYQAINSTGKSVLGAVMVAEVVSCLKRALARMLVIIVSLGFGIVKPRLGPLLHRVVGVGTLYFILSVFEAYIRVYTLRNNPYRQYLLADMLLAVLDSFICWWIFSSLVQTTRTLRLRRNIVKLSLYRHFTNTLIFAVIASVGFMVWSVTNHKKPLCVKDWKELWVEEAYWRLLFTTILLVIMILWRPTNNNQRYAFMPLLDAPDDEEDETVMSDAFDGMKMRPSKNHTIKDNQTKGVEDDLKWVEENIPSTIADVALPSLLDSDEEIMTTKFEISKMN